MSEKKTAQFRIAKSQGILLYLFVIPPFLSVVFALMSLHIKAFVLDLVSFSLFFAALHFSKRGFKEEFSYHLATYAFKPKIPYKLLGALFLSIAVFYTSFFISQRTLFVSLFLAIIAFLGYILWYGVDPLQDKLPKSEVVGSKVALQTLKEAADTLRKARYELVGIKDSQLKESMDETLQAAGELLETIEKNPDAIRRSRKFLVVYTQSLQEVITAYKDAQGVIDDKKKHELLQLLQRVEKSFRDHAKEMQEYGLADFEIKKSLLDIQMKER